MSGWAIIPSAIGHPSGLRVRDEEDPSWVQPKRCTTRADVTNICLWTIFIIILYIKYIIVRSDSALLFVMMSVSAAYAYLQALAITLYIRSPHVEYVSAPAIASTASIVQVFVS